MSEVTEILINSIANAMPYITVAIMFAYLINKFIAVYLKSKEYEHDKFRLDLEKQAYELSKQMTYSSERFKSVNELAIQGNIKQSLNRGSVNSDQFLRRMGISKRLEVKDKSVFVLTPLNPDFQEDYEWIKNAFSNRRYVCAKGDDLKVDNNLLNHIIKEMVSSQIVVANITGRNANVFYELGIAHALGKDVLIVARNDSDITFDLSSTQILIYKSEEELASKVDDWLISKV